LIMHYFPWQNRFGGSDSNAFSYVSKGPTTMLFPKKKFWMV